MRRDLRIVLKLQKIIAARRASQAALARRQRSLSALQAAEPTPPLNILNRLPEFSLADKVILVSGAARGLGLTQAEALLEAGATGEPAVWFQISIASRCLSNGACN